MKNTILSILFFAILITTMSNVVYVEDTNWIMSIKNYNFDSSNKELIVNANIRNNNQDAKIMLALYNDKGVLISYKYETILKSETEKTIKVNANRF